MLKFRRIKARLFWWWNFRRPNWLKNHFIKREYLVLEVDGTPCTMRPVDAADTLQDADDPKAYKVKSVWMTPHQFDAMPEFQGW
jgi:hypothetical protein